MDWREFYVTIQKYYHIEEEDTVTKIPFENIIDVNADTLVFKDNDGNVSQIVLAECVNNLNSVFDEKLKDFSGNDIRAVGGRFFSKPIAFYEFFTEGHHTRFCMTIKQTRLKRIMGKMGLNVDTKAFSKFYSLQEKLISFGYSAIDLT